MVVKYKYDLNGSYYEIDGNKLKKISKKKYLEKTGNKEKNIDKLKKSLYPWQVSNYVILTYPKSFPSDIKGRDVPVDYILSNLVKYLWKKKIITGGWDKGLEVNDKKIKKYNHPAFITMDHKTNNGKDVMPILEKMFGKRNIVVFNYIKNPKQEPDAGKQTRDQRKKDMKKYPKKIRIYINEWFMSIVFNPSMIGWIHKKLKIKLPDGKKALHGYRVLHESNLKKMKVVK